MNCCEQWPQFRDFLLKNKDWNVIFAPRGEILREGQIIRRTNLANTLQKISDHGAHEFYHVSSVFLDELSGLSRQSSY